jgi:AraC family transcriptional activator of pyochelin receptor
MHHCAKEPGRETGLYGLRSVTKNGDGRQHESATACQHVDLRDGLCISKLELAFKVGSKLRYHKQPAMIDFGFILSGQVSHKLKTDAMGGRLTAHGGMAGIGYFPGRAGIMEALDGKTLKVLHVHITPERLNRMVGTDIAAMPPNLRPIIEGATRKDYLAKSSMDPGIQVAALDVFNGRYHGIPQCLYLEGKAMELISLQLSRLISVEVNTKNSVPLSRNEKDRILAAHDMLVSDLSAPPSLTELADHFCLSQNKLQTGFHELFGRSVFECLREYKMQKARQLFTRAEMNVSQVAWAVGYTNVSQFTKAYKKRFGVLPKHYRRSVLQNA